MAGREAAALTNFVTIEKGLGPDGRVAVVRFDRGDGIKQRCLWGADSDADDDASGIRDRWCWQRL